MGFLHVCSHMYVCTPSARCIDKHTDVSRSLTPGGGSDRIRKCIIFLGSLNVKLNPAVCIRVCSMHVHSYVFMCKCVFDVFLLRPTARYRRVHGQFVVLEQSFYEVETMDYLYYEMLHFGCQPWLPAFGCHTATHCNTLQQPLAASKPAGLLAAKVEHFVTERVHSFRRARALPA